MTTTTEAEYTKHWDELSQGEIECAIASHCIPLGLCYTNKNHFKTLKRIFDIGKPTMTFCHQWGILSD